MPNKKPRVPDGVLKQGAEDAAREALPQWRRRGRRGRPKGSGKKTAVLGAAAAPMDGPTKILIFGSRDDSMEGWARAQRCARRLTEKGCDVKLVDKRTFDLEDLRLVANHRVISTPCIVVLRGETVVARRQTLLSAPEILVLAKSVEVGACA